MAKVFRKMTGILLAVCMLASLFTCLLGLSVSAAGTTPDLVQFKGTDWAVLKYVKGWSTIQAGNYKFIMDCKIVSGVPRIQVGAEATGAALDAQSNYVATYDEVNYKYIITFTMTSNWSGNLGAMVGNYGTGGRVGNCTGDAVFYCANPTLYLLDGNGNPTGSSLFNTFASDYYSTSRAGNKWWKAGISNSSATFTSPVPSGFFDPEPEVVPDIVHFEEYRNDCSRWLYRAPYTTQAAGNYKFTMDCKIFSGTPTINVGSADYGGNTFNHTDAFKNYTATYDAENFKYIITFTFDTAFTGSDRIGVFVGNYGTSGNFVAANPELYLLDGNGNPTGSNLIKTFASVNYWSSGSKAQLWERAGNYTVKNLPDNYFETSANSYAAHFIGGSDNYQVMAYKDTCIYAYQNTTYRLKIDINNFSSVEPSVQMRTGNDIGTSYTGTLISTDGFERVYEFTVTDSATGIGLFIGNFGKGTDLDFAFRNPRLYVYKNGTYGTTNMLKYFGPGNVRSGWSGSRTNAVIGEWTPINCSSSLLQYGNDDGTYFPDPIADAGTEKMANVYHGFSYRSFIYNDSAVALKKGHTYVLSMKQKVASGSPTVNIYEATGGSNNDINNSTYTSAYNDVTNGYTRTVTFTMAKSISVLRIRIGNNSEKTDVAASFADVSLKEQGDNTELIAGFTSENFTTSGHTNRKWYIASQQQGNNVITHNITDIPTNYFTDSPVKHMYYISEATTAYSGLEYNAKLDASTTYKLEFDWRNYDGAYPKVAITYYNGSAWSSVAQTATSANKVDGTTTSLSGNLLPASVMNTSHYGHYSVTFTTPSDISTEGYRNLNILFANYITNDDYTHYGRGSTYYGNFKLQKSGVSGNAILNGDLAIAGKTGLVSSNDSGGYKFPGFVIGIGKNNGSRDLYNDLAILPQLDGFFTAAGANIGGNQYKKLVKFNGGDYDYIRQEMRLQSNTQYILYYNYTYVNAENGPYIQQVDSDNNFSSPAMTTTVDKQNSIKYLVFTTGSNLRSTYCNFYLNMFIGRNAPDASFYFTNVQIRKWNGTSIVGPNLVDNGGFFFGEDASGENAITIPVSEEKQVTETNTLQLLGWKTYGKFSANTNIEVIDANASFFQGYKEFNTRLPLIRKIHIGFETSTNHPYEDPDNDEVYSSVKDYVHTKLAWIEAENGTATVAAAEQFKATYVNGNNTTDLTGMDINLFGNKTRPTGTVYYVDDVNGNDSNSGTSPSSAWKTLNKVNTASISSGSAVLFKCGGVWRAKTNECTSSDPNKGVLRCKNGVTYGSYGSGNKPIIVGSYYNYKSRTWTSAGTNIWKTNINLSGYYHGNDVGIIVYNYGSLIGKMTLKKADLAHEGEFWCREPNGTDGGDGYVYVYCTENPANHWKSIEIGQKRHLCDLANNCTVNNICFKYGGLHGLTGSNLSAVCISNCEIACIGGAYNSSRLGNGVELALTAANCRVKNCYVRECYDAGLTFQCWEGTGSFQSINFSNNLIENCNYSIEYFVNNASDKMKDIYIMNNICRGAGYGWSYDEREGYSKNEDDIGCYRTAHIRCTARGDLHYTNLSEFYIQNNIFDCSKGALIHWWWNAKDSASPFDYDGLHISGNTFYQASRSDDDRILHFRDESAIYGISTYSVREALKKFEGTDTPTHLNDSKYIVGDNVISTY